MTRRSKRTDSGPILLLGAALFLVLGGGMITGGVHRLVVRHSGRRQRATVRHCTVTTDSRYRRSTICTGSWFASADLALGKGQLVTGTINGAGVNDEGKTLEVITDGDEAYVPSKLLPDAIVSLCVGVLLFGLGVLMILVRPRARQRVGTLSGT